MSTEKPRIEGARGLKFRRTAAGWEARWKARDDLIARGYVPKSVRLWVGAELDEIKALEIADRCERLQAEMLVWSSGGYEQYAAAYDGTLRSLIHQYRSDPDSGYKKIRYKTRTNYDTLLDRLDSERSETRIADIRARVIDRWHETWSASGKVVMARGLIGMLRTLFSYGNKYLECPECARMKGILSDMRFKMGKKREKFLTAEQAQAVIEKARECGYYSIALAQAFQFEATLRQKDAIGEVVPMDEPGLSDVLMDGKKWMRGLRWQEIDQNLILTHITSKKEKEIVVDLKLAPMVMEELRYVAQRVAWAKFGAKAIHDGSAPMPPLPEVVTRDDLPASGPVVICDFTARPWYDSPFRRTWRKVARMAGVPDDVFNMDTRAGAITEATEAGVDLEHIRHAAAHSNTGMTAHYARAGTKKIASTMKSRVEHRNKPGTTTGGTDVERE